MNDLAKFKRMLISKTHRSANTIDAYMYTIEEFYYFVKNKNKSLKEITLDVITEYMNKKTSADGISLRSMARNLSAIKQFYKYMGPSYNEHISYNYIQIPVFKKTDPFFISKDDINKIFKTLNKDDYFYGRDVCLISLLYYQGLKLSEALDITFSDIRHNNKLNTIFIKSRNKDVIVTDTNLEKYLSKYITIHRPKFNYFESSYLFISNKSGHLNRKAAWKVILKRIREANINKRVTADVLRNSFIIHKLDEKIPLDKIKELSNLKTDDNLVRYIRAYKNQKEVGI